MLTALDDAAVGQWCRAAVEALSDFRARLDDLNVFPVPDGDTGTNLLLTAEGALAALDQAPPGEPTWAVVARGAVLSARGNSGTILAQLLRGLADQLAGQPPADGPVLAAAMRKAAEGAYTAVADPEEGTFLTVARAAGEAAVAAVDEGRTALADVVGAAADGAHRALEGTPDQLAALREAGVVDAGGAGLSLVLDALVRTVTGVQPVRPALARRAHAPHDHVHAPHQPPPGPGSEVQYLLADADEASVARLHERLAALGDSLVVVGVDTPTGREWNVHVHVADVGAAIEAGIEAGRPHRITVTPLAPVPPAAPAPGVRAVVAAVHSEGLAELFRAEGARVVVCEPGGITEDDLYEEIVAAGAQEVVVLPNDAGLHAVASRAAERAREAGREIGVVPTRSPVQGLAALAVGDPQRRFGDDVIAMAEAAAATRWAELAVADQEALTSAGLCRPGDVLGSAEGDVVVIGAEHAAVACDLLDRLLSAGGEMATLVVGPDEALGDAVCAHLSSAHPTVEVVRYGGGPGSLPLQIGVE
ncbi:DAK2 domain-containing protein [Blastococcus sp. MG754426]|uniref:DAK2 domain-containing protein n=1 Tax=unclassified Blastococcus TaxID=2619396 RepID=UPI001EF03984|nr:MULTISPECIES: DAK2 domain-containing protein [unclassified Blastococcus]MCF6505866.1 DAK2 domain-containing protein [Blastococcus sp. MG754426]MCF6511054.1 DAK2 domain-containing protein [Blastococcus sp. MG754427]MCF6735021.1 DAK2 domain-containing protein [Blastococcus sp. KM273129]